MGNGRCVGMGGGLGGRGLLVWAHCTADTLRVPGGRTHRAGQRSEKSSYIRISRWVRLKNCIVDIPRLQMPGIEYHLFISLIGINLCPHSFSRVIENNRAYTRRDPELKLVTLSGKLAEERFILANRIALIIENGPAAPDPARINYWSSIHYRTGCCLGFLLRLTTESIGGDEADLDFGVLSRRKIAKVRFARESGCESWLPLSGIIGHRRPCVLEVVGVINHTSGSVAQQVGGQSRRIVGPVKGVYLCLRQIREKAIQGISHRFR